MLTVLIATLFAAAACFALIVIADSWRSHSGAALALRQQLRECTTVRELRFSLITTEVRHSGATVYRPNFRPEARALPFQPPLRAAA